MLNFKKLLINQKSSTLDAIKVINSNNHRIGFVIDNKNKLLGSITDGDIRRAIIKKIDFKKNVLLVCNKKPYFLYKDKLKNIKKFKNDNYIPIVDNRKKVINIKIIKSKNNKVSSALIMAGGKGKRLYPLTKYIPKPLIKIKGKTLIESLCSKLLINEIKDINISVHHMHNKIQKHLKNVNKHITNKSFILEKKPLGTGGAISLFKSKDENFFVINCDVKLDLDFSKISNFHINQKADMTIVSKQTINKLSFGRLNINSKFKVLSIEEKPELTNYINTGIYILNKKIKNLIKKNQKINMDEIIEYALKKKMKVVTYPLYENWIDLGIRKNLKRYQKSKNSN